jgi:hypothetical protein
VREERENRIHTSNPYLAGETVVLANVTTATLPLSISFSFFVSFVFSTPSLMDVFDRRTRPPTPYQA